MPGKRGKQPAKTLRGGNRATSGKVAIYTRTSTNKNSLRLMTSRSRQIESCMHALKSNEHRVPNLNKVLKVSEVKSGRLPLAKRPAFQELISGKKGAIKVFVESARAVARDAGDPAVRNWFGLLELYLESICKVYTVHCLLWLARLPLRRRSGVPRRLVGRAADFFKQTARFTVRTCWAQR